MRRLLIALFWLVWAVTPIVASAKADIPSGLKSAIADAELTPEFSGFASEGERFGGALAVSGDLALIGASSSADGGFTSNGDVLVFAYDSTSEEWSLETQLLPQELVEGLGFGASIGFDGMRAVIGAPSADEPITDAGAAYVFRRDAPGVWVEEAVLRASDGGFGDSFGHSVSVDGDAIAVGAYLDDDGGSNAGAVYLFAPQGGGLWTEAHKIAGATSQDQFGYAVALEGELLAVGGPFADGTVSASGAVSAYRRDIAGVWQFEGLLSAVAATGGDQQGLSVAVATDTIFVGAPYDDTVDSAAGAIHIFEYGAGNWTESTTITAATSQRNDHVGIALAVNGDLLLAGADGDDTVVSNAGAAHVFKKQMDGSWLLDATLRPANGASQDSAGRAVALHGDNALIGIGSADDLGSNTGAVSVFQQNAGTWVEDVRLNAGRGSAFDAFGTAVAIDGNLAIVGVPGDDAVADGAGAAYVFEEVAGSWVLIAQLLASDAAIGHAFGSVVDLDAGRAVVGAPGAVPGNVYIYEAANGWAETERLQGPADLFDFGYAVAVDADRLVVSGIAANLGSVTVYDRGVSDWQETARLQPDIPSSSSRFADAIAMHNDVIVVGARLEDTLDTDAGAAYVFGQDMSGTWSQIAILQAGDGDAFHYFGTSVAVHGDHIGVGSPGADFGANGAGSVYVFDRLGGSWQQTHRLDAQTPSAGDELGSSLVMTGETLIAGAPDNGDQVGRALVFQRDPSGNWLESLRIQLIDGNDGDELGAAVGLSDERWMVGVPGGDESGSNAGLALIGKLAANAAPIANDDLLSTDEDTPLTANLLEDNGSGVDGDADGDAIAIVEATVDGQSHVVGSGGESVGLASGGTLTVGMNGVVAFDPVDSYDTLAPNEQSVVSFSYTIEDAQMQQSSADVTITILGVDDPPIPVDDMASVDEDSEGVVFDVLANDADPDGGDTVIASLTPASMGTVRLVQFGRAVEYTPISDACTTANPDQFDYVLDGGDTGRVNVNISCIDDLPVAESDSFAATEDESVHLAVLDNDADIDGGPLQIESFTSPNHASLSLDAENLIYTPDDDYCSNGEADTFSYTVNGGSTASVSVSVACVDDPGVASADDYQILEDTDVLLDVVANDSDVDGGSLIESMTQPEHGVAVLTNPLASYVPDTDYCGTDSWQYTLNGGSSATVTVDVLCVNDPPRLQLEDIFEPSGSTGFRSLSILESLTFGGPDESDQLLIQENAVEVFDFDNVVDSVQLLDGVLEFQLTGNDGSADIAITLQDDAGVSNGGTDTSQSVLRVFVSPDVVPDLSGTANAPSVVFAGSGYVAQVTVINQGLQAALADISVTLDAQIVSGEVECEHMAGDPCAGAKGLGWVLALAPSEFVTITVEGLVAEAVVAPLLRSEVKLVDLGGNEIQYENNIVTIETAIGLFSNGFE